MEKGKNQLIIFTRIYDLTLWMMNHTSKFPKSSRFSISVKIESNMLELLGTILMANRRRNKTTYLEKADEILEQLRILVRLSKDMEFLNIKSYGFAARNLDEIGRLLGGWMKQQKQV